MPKKSILFLMLYLSIRNRSLTNWTPVDNAGSFINISFFIQFGKYFQNRIGTALIHCKTLSVPICGRSQFMKLCHNTASILLFPFPSFFQKTFSAQILLINPLFAQLINHLNLCSNCCMICSRLPECFISLHSLITDQDVLHCIIQSMSHMKLSCDIWRWHYNGKWFFSFSFSSLCISMEIFLIQPLLIQPLLNI